MKHNGKRALSKSGNIIKKTRVNRSRMNKVTLFLSELKNSLTIFFTLNGRQAGL